MMTIILNTHNRHGAFHRLLASIPYREDVELLVADTSTVRPVVPTYARLLAMDPATHPLLKINQAIEACQYDRFWLLCDDTELLPESYEAAFRQIQQLTDDQLGIFCQQNVFPDHAMKTDGICGTVAGNLIATKEAFQKSGGWDGAFHWHHGDRDLRRRAVQKGLQNVVLPGVCVKHYFVHDVTRHSVDTFWKADTALFPSRWPDQQTELLELCPVHHGKTSSETIHPLFSIAVTA